MGLENLSSPRPRMRPAEAGNGQSGFSLVEVLIAAGIFLIVALGVLPIFSQAIVNNRSGADYTQATNFAKSEVERLYSLPFSSPELTVAGAATVRTDYFSQKDQKWVVGVPSAGDPPQWTRTTTIRQYGLGGMVDFDEDGTLEGPLPAGAPASAVHAKEIEVQVVSGRAVGNTFGVAKRITLKVFKAY